MTRARWTESIVSRLVVSFFLGGLSLSVAFSVLEYDRELSLLRVTESQQLVMSTHNLQEVLREMMPSRRTEALRTALEIFQQDPRILAVRLNTAESGTFTIGDWPANTDHAALWAFTSGDPEPQGNMDFSRQTVMVRSFFGYGDSHTLQVLIDGRYMHQQMRRDVLRQLSRTWLLLGVMMLAGLLVLRRWLAMALRRLLGLVARGAPANEFIRAGEELHGEMGVLAKRIAQMLEKNNATERNLREREQAFEELYLHAPSALIGFGRDGQIREANARAAELLDADDPQALIGRNLIGYITPEDRTVFRRAIRRAESDVRDRCTLRVDCMAGRQRELNTELTRVGNGNGEQLLIRAGFTDVTETRRLARSHSEQRHLLELLIDHLAEAVLVVDESGVVTRASQRVGGLVGREAEQIVGETFDPVEFWKPLEPCDPVGFERVMREAGRGSERHMHEQFEARGGTFRFHVIPVRDESLCTVARLWVVQEITTQVAGQRLLDQKDAQSKLMRRLGQELIGAANEEELIGRMLASLRPALDADAIGIALRDERGRVRQGVWLGADRCDTTVGRRIVRCVAQRMTSGAPTPNPAAQWVDVGKHANMEIGLAGTDLGRFAVVPIGLEDATQGVIWMARIQGRPAENTSIYLLESVLPILSVAINAMRSRDTDNHAKKSDIGNGTTSHANGHANGHAHKPRIAVEEATKIVS